MKKVKTLLITLSLASATMLPAIAISCKDDKKPIDKEPQPDPITKPIEKPNPDPITKPIDEPKPININKDFLNLNNDELLAKYVSNINPTLKDNIRLRKTAFLADQNDLKDLELKPSETENVEIISIKPIAEENRNAHWDDLLQFGKMKFDYKFKVFSKGDSSVFKEFSNSYVVDGYIGINEYQDILKSKLDLTKASNFEIDKSKLLIDIDKEARKGYNNSYKFFVGSYYNHSVEKAITPKVQDDVVKVSFEYDKNIALPDKQTLFIEPFLYFDTPSMNYFFIYGSGKSQPDETSTITFNNLPIKALSARAIVDNYQIDRMFSFDKNILKKELGKNLIEIPTNDVNVETLNKGLRINHNLVNSKTNKPEDKFDLTSDFIKKSNVRISKITPNEYEGVITVQFTLDSIPVQNENGVIYLGDGIRQSQNINNFATATFNVNIPGFKITKEIKESDYEERKVLQLSTAMNWDKFIIMWDSKGEGLFRKPGVLQKYTKAKTPFIGISGGGVEDTNLFFTPISPLTLDSILTTTDKNDQKYLKATLNKETKTLIIYYKLADQGDKLFKQTVVFE
ncbi:hypothetical protein [Mycoplasmopsis verecunda]|uniref:Lipoprotein n=1 Tax=Mycoplasmopsis verecunda TaxID=171291 RepID=A0A1T4KFM9_9BACT|nr:hypothetical protein [Mycoplasmopsis verecunda]WPB54891.1 hypothetical protein SAM46_01905 [Mycoplasmopsis verecunda]SJZ41210.1 hypothetical protein SAMN02745154_00039 [Mycoplasmopsis verecunda]